MINDLYKVEGVLSDNDSELVNQSYNIKTSGRNFKNRYYVSFVINLNERDSSKKMDTIIDNSSNGDIDVGSTKKIIFN